MTFPTEKKELLFGAGILICAMFLINCLFFGGLQLGFAIASVLCILCSSAYLLANGRKLTTYGATLLVLSLVIAVSFARSDDSLVKLVMVLFLLVSTNLSLCLLAGKNRYAPGSAASLLDAANTLFSLGVGEMPASWRGLSNAFRRTGTVGQKSTAVLLGLGFAVPVLIIIIPLLIQADAAFEGLLQDLPRISLSEIILTVLFGFCTGYVLYTRNTALQHLEAVPAATPGKKKISTLTVNTVLIAVCLVYFVYLLSQLAYFTGGFAGILPENYTLAQYARRGFFEMAWLCAINLSILVLAIYLSAGEGSVPPVTAGLCLFLGIFTLFLVATASAKMILYIDSYGLTRLRVLTQVIMIFLGIVTTLLCIRLFAPRLPYMKAVVITGLLMGAAVSWADVNTQVARYNVDAYLDGRMETVDIAYLDSLGDGVVPHLVRLSQQAKDTAVADQASTVLLNRWYDIPEDFRGWNYVNHIARRLLPEKARQELSQREFWQIMSDTAIPDPEYTEEWDTHGGFHGDGLFFGAATFSSYHGETLADQMHSSSMWKPLPLNGDLERLLYGTHTDTETFLSPLTVEGRDIPHIENGYYYFYDRHDESTDPSSTEGIFLRASFNFNLAIYDTDTDTLYYWELDT